MSADPPGYRRRHVDALIDELLAALPALMLLGPRAVGKTTTALQRARTVVALDRPREAEVVRADPDAFLRGLQEPVLLDEWQIVPEVLGAVKRAIDRDTRPGRFLLTGSARAPMVEQTWPGTGRVVNIPMYGLSVRELRDAIDGPGLIDRILAGQIPDTRSGEDLRDYVGLALTSGFPEAALRLDGHARRRWLEGYVDHVTGRDALTVERGRDPQRLSRYLQAVAMNSAGVVADKTVYEAAGLTAPTARAYEALLAALFVVDALPAWTSNRLKRLVLGSKRYLVDPALVAAVLRLDEQAFMRDADLLGRLLDTFVVSQLRCEIETITAGPRLYHLRQQQGRREVDVLAEVGGREVVAMEVKATSVPRASDGRHLAWLRDELGARFVHGLVFHTGPRSFSLGERITALPIAALWT